MSKSVGRKVDENQERAELDLKIDRLPTELVAFDRSFYPPYEEVCNK